jgi:hypothetical protein
LGTAGALPTQLFRVLAVIGELVVVMVPALAVHATGGQERVVDGHGGFGEGGCGGAGRAIALPCEPVLPVMSRGLPETPVTVNVPLRPL